jgi:hypothetical protein
MQESRTPVGYVGRGSPFRAEHDQVPPLRGTRWFLVGVAERDACIRTEFNMHEASETP